MLSFVRHGERGDNVRNWSKDVQYLNVPASRREKHDYLINGEMNPDDPPLTKKGYRQAIRTGEFMKQAFKQVGFDIEKVRIKTSPFLRSIMTAAGIT